MEEINSSSQTPCPGDAERTKPSTPVVGTSNTAFQPYVKKSHQPDAFSSHLPRDNIIDDASSVSASLLNSAIMGLSDCRFQSGLMSPTGSIHNVIPGGLIGAEIEGDRSSLASMSLEMIYDKAKAAITKVQRTKAMLKDYFQSFDQSRLTPYQLPRVTALLHEANLIGSVELNPNQSNVYDLVRLIRCCTRQADWLMQILVECQNIMTKESDFSTV
jgi:hypothetical protein